MMAKVEELAMCALSMLVVTGFVAISVTFFVGSLLLCWALLTACWRFTV